jgi:hypothetical protein
MIRQAKASSSQWKWYMAYEDLSAYSPAALSQSVDLKRQRNGEKRCLVDGSIRNTVLPSSVVYGIILWYDSNRIAKTGTDSWRLWHLTKGLCIEQDVETRTRKFRGVMLSRLSDICDLTHETIMGYVGLIPAKIIRHVFNLHY